MARIPRLLLVGQSATYHVVSRSALPGYPLGDVEKDQLLVLIRRFSSIYFAEVLGFCLMGNHFHLAVRMHTGDGIPDEEIAQRYLLWKGHEDDPDLFPGQIPTLREKWASLSEYVKEIKQSFARWFNRRSGRAGYFWGERFKSVVVEDGDTLINVLAYLDLNPVRAGIVERPEDYRWSSLGYHLQTANQGGFLSLNLALRPYADLTDDERLTYYRKFVYEVGSVPNSKGAAIPEETYQGEQRRDFEISTMTRLRCRTRHFTESGVIGTKQFVAACADRFAGHFACKHPKKPHPVTGLDGVFSLKRLRKPA